MIDDAAALDRQDVLAHCRLLFDLPRDVIYLDGNSLGALPRAVKERLHQTVEQQWGQDLIQSWNRHDWINLPKTVGEKIAPLIGAAPAQVICTDSTSINLFKLITAALAVNPGRTRILSQRDNFPTDLYMAEGVVDLLGSGRAELVLVDESALEASLQSDTAVLMLTHVNFRDGSVHDMARLTKAAHKAGALVIWDLSHSTGVFPLELDRLNVDFAVGCGYKYLNGGPGAPAYLYVNERLHDGIKQPLAGWMGHENAFEFSPEYRPAPGISRYLTGTPGILSMQALSAALDVYRDIDLRAVREKSIALTSYFLHLIDQHPDLTVLSPVDSRYRGSQVSLSHQDAYAIVQALISDGVIGDFREPNILRFGFAPLYTRFVDVEQAAKKLLNTLASGHYKSDRFQRRHQVT